MSNQNSLKKNVIANYLGNGWMAIMHIAFIPYYIKYLGMEAYGLIGFYAMLLTGLSLLDMGMTPALGREMARFTGGAHTSHSIRNLLRSIELIATSIVILYIVVIWLASNWIAHSWLQVGKLPLQTVAQACSIIGFVTALRFIEGLYRSAILGLQKQVILSFTNSLMATLRSGGALLVLIFIEPTIRAYFIWQAIVSIITVIAFIIILYSSLPKSKCATQFSMSELSKIKRFAAGVMATTLLAIILTQVDKLILSRLIPLEDFGSYTFVATIAGVLIMLVGPISQSHYPKLSELQSQNEIKSLKKVFHRGSQLATVISGTSAVILIFFGNTIVSIWTGNGVLATNIDELLKIMILGTFLNSLMHMPYMLQLAYGWSTFSAKVNLIAVLFLVPAILFIAPKYGAIGASWVWVTLNLGYVFISSHFMFKKIFTGEHLKWLLEDIAYPLLSSLLIVWLFWYLKPNIGNQYIMLCYIFCAGIMGLITAAFFANELRMYTFDKISKKC